MPRSGTTLTEQIISNHSEVYGADELNNIPNLAKPVDKIVNCTKENLKMLGEKYINDVKKISNNSKFITDKLPINFMWIGFIKLILPNSKIIHCMRDSRDNCFSIFKNFFPSTNLNFAYDLNEIVEYYNLYLEMMKHWRTVLPGFINDINYEKIVQSPENEIRSLIKKSDLNWEDNCLEFYKSKRIIKTASDIQVRKKLYNTSINFWKNYENDLGSFFKVLPN